MSKPTPVTISGSGVRNVTLTECEWKDLVVLVKKLTEWNPHPIPYPNEALSHGCVTIAPVQPEVSIR